jgi:FeS assembly SUF system protein
MTDHDYNPYLPDGPGSRLADGPGLADFLPDTSSGYRATAGTKLEAPGGPADSGAVEEALKSVHDPEIPVNIFDLGLIYEVDRHESGDVYITMSLTAPGCPVAGEMPGQVAEAVAAVAGVGEVIVELVWDPAWTPERMSEDAKLALDLGF